MSLRSGEVESVNVAGRFAIALQDDLHSSSVNVGIRFVLISAAKMFVERKQLGGE